MNSQIFKDNDLKKTKVALFFGGPSTERNISLDSARTFFDAIYHLFDSKNIFLIFFDHKLNPILLNHDWIYCNTVEDFEGQFQTILSTANPKIATANSKIATANSKIATANSKKSIAKSSRKPTALRVAAGEHLSNNQLIKIIRDTDVLVPLIHGRFGEDGKLVDFFKKLGNNGWLGSSSETLALTMDKYKTLKKLRQFGFLTASSMLFENPSLPTKSVAQKVLGGLNIKSKNEYLFVKPNDGGSSDGVSMVRPQSIIGAIEHARKFSNSVLIEKRIEGREFSIIVIEDSRNEAVALYPTEIIIEKSDDHNNSFYTRRKKYMPGSGANHQTPAHFDTDTLSTIRNQASIIFESFNFSHWARLDGFLDKKGNIIWSELNGIPGVGIDSFLFQQSIIAGLDIHHTCLHLLSLVMAKKKNTFRFPSSERDNTEPILKSSHYRRLDFIEHKDYEDKNNHHSRPNIFNKQLIDIERDDGQKVVPYKKSKEKKKKIALIGGGESSEKQVSRMSWHNISTKLSPLTQFDITHYYLDEKNTFWQVPTNMTMMHTVEEINEALDNRKRFSSLLNQASKQLMKDFCWELSSDISYFLPKKVTVKRIAKNNDYAFLCLHGGMGENGELQLILEKNKLPFNGSNSHASRLASDKYNLNSSIRKRKMKEIETLASFSFTLDELNTHLKKNAIDSLKIKKLIQRSTKNTKTFQKFSCVVMDFFRPKLEENNLDLREIVFKPSQDGCSTGILVLKQQKSIALSDIREKVLKRRIQQMLLSSKKDSLDTCVNLAILCDYLLFLLAKKKNIPLSFIDLQTNELEQVLALPEISPNSKQSLKIIGEAFFDTSHQDQLEMTVTVMGKKGKMKALMPSETVKEKSSLSLEEKFLKGTGPNHTPPPSLTEKQIKDIRSRIGRLSNKLGLSDYARIDIFFNKKSNRLFLIEINTLPGLTAATVLFTQGLVTPGKRKKPAELLQEIISYKLDP